MRSVHLVVPDLFLPKEVAAPVCAGLRLPTLERLLSRGCGETLDAVSLEGHLSGLFGLSADAGVAAIGAAYEGLGTGHWLRIDPVHLQVQRDWVVLQEVSLGAGEAAEFCASLNRQFSGDGLEFFAPHPQRWYVRLDAEPGIETVPLSQAIGRNVLGLMPKGEGAARWLPLINEIQMLLFAHEANARREARGEWPVNSVWLWGEGRTAATQARYRDASSDEVLVGMFAAAAGMPFSGWSGQWADQPGDGEQLLVWNGLRRALLRGDLAAWRDALQTFEAGYAQPLWQALRGGKIGRLQLDILGVEGVHRVSLTRADAWAFWRRSRGLAGWSMV